MARAPASPPAPRRNLVIVRAGKASLHPRWFEGAPSRNWDIILSYFDPEARHDNPPDAIEMREPGGKWDGLYRTIDAADIFERYDYVWLPDDDIDTNCADINRMFDLMRAHDLSVAQPALTHDSYYAHFLFNACPGFRLRYTNYIEIMVPCLRTSLLRAIHRDFDGTMSGFGLDYIWCRVDAAGRGGAAIMDEVAMHHTRPIGQNLRKAMAKVSLSPEDEEMTLRRRYGVARRVVPIAYAALDRDGRRIEGKRRLGLRMGAAYLSDLPGFADRRLAFWKIVQLVRRQFTKPLDLTPLTRVESGTRRVGAAEA